MNQQSPQTGYSNHGYHLARSVFDPEQLQTMIEAFDRIADELAEDVDANNARWDGKQIDAIDGGVSVILHTHNIQSYSGAWMRALMDEKFLDIAEELIGPDIVLHHSKLFLKPPSIGSPFPMHQDWEHFPCQQDKMMAAVIHLSDTDEVSGCLRLYPGSHKLGRLKGMRGEGAGSKQRKEFSVDKAIPMPAKAGDDRVESGNRHSNVKLALRGNNHHASRRVTGSIR